MMRRNIAYRWLGPALSMLRALREAPEGLELPWRVAWRTLIATLLKPAGQ